MKKNSSTETQKSFAELVNSATQKTSQPVQGAERTATSYLGGAKGLFDSVEAVDRFILNERRSWTNPND